MFVRVRLFAILRERAGNDHVEVELPDSATVEDLVAAVAAQPGLAGVGGGSARVAINRVYADPHTPVGPDDEVALIPPVSGGAPIPEHLRADATRRVAVGREPLDHAELLAFVEAAEAGGAVTFAGYPRDVSALDYEAYPEMAVERMWAILGDALSTHGLCAAAAAHRVGSVPAREASIVVAASAPHRGEAFAGAREILDRIKAEAPIWKVEVDVTGTRRRPEGTLPG